MTALDRRLARPQAVLSPPRPSPPVRDWSRLTPDQQSRLAVLTERYLAVGLAGLTDRELTEMSDLVRILEHEADRQPRARTG